MCNVDIKQANYISICAMTHQKDFFLSENIPDSDTTEWYSIDIGGNYRRRLHGRRRLSCENTRSRKPSGDHGT